MKNFMLSLQFAAFSFLCISNIHAQNWNQILKTGAGDRESKNESARSSLDFFGLSVAISQNYAVVGAVGEDDDADGKNPIDLAGAAYLYQYTNGTWRKIRKLCAGDRQMNANFGFSVALTDDFVVVGSPGQSNSQGQAYIFKKDEGGANNWGLIKVLTPSKSDNSDSFGRSVSIDGNTVVVTALYDADDASESNPVAGAGSAYVFAKDLGGLGNWGQSSKITAPDRAVGSNLGSSVSINGDYILLGARANGQDMHGGNTIAEAGAAYIFKKDSGIETQWNFIKKIVASDRGAYQNFGHSVSISGDYAVIGKPGDFFNSSLHLGAAYIFNKNAGGPDNWGEIKKITAPVRYTDDNFGTSVSLSGEYLVIGSSEERPEPNPNAEGGSAYVYKKNNDGNDQWGLVKKIIAPVRKAYDFFGYSVSISGENVISGAWREDEDQWDQSTLEMSGSAYVYNKIIGGSDNWGLFRKLTASSDHLRYRQYGRAVAISGNYAIVGTSNNVMDINGTLNNSGAAYILYNNVGTWTEVAKITPPENILNAGFGSRVAIDGKYAVVGAMDENNNPPSGQPADYQGAAYLYEKDRGGTGNWGFVKKLTAPIPSHSAYYGCSVAVSGDYVVVGAQGYKANSSAPNDYTGAAFLYKKNNDGADNWGLQKMLKSDLGFSGDYFGYSVSMSGNTIVVGASQEGFDFQNGYKEMGTGAAYIFEENHGGTENWGFKQKLTPPAHREHDRFGWAVSLEGNYLIIGAPYHDWDANEANEIDGTGAAYIYKRDPLSGIWLLEKKVTAPFRERQRTFGMSVSITADHALVGLYNDPYDSSQSNYVYLSGAAFIFQKNKNGTDQWGLVQKLVPQYRAQEDYYGWSVAMSGKYAIVGAFGDDEDSNEKNLLLDSGSAYIYRNNDAALPVTLVSFEANRTENQTSLKWSTAQESNSDYFEMQRSKDGFSWEPLQTVKASDESNALMSYSYMDTSPLNGENLYRLKMVDGDGTFAYSRIRSIFFENSDELRLYPNPVSDRLYFPASSDYSPIQSVKLVNNLGQIVSDIQKISSDGIPVRHLTPGFYTVQIKRKAGTSTIQKILITR